MKTTLSVLIVLVAGLTGLALVFTDWVPLPLGWPRLLGGAAFYFAVGLALGRLRPRPIAWSILAAWGLILLGLVGLWISFTDPASGDLPLALVFLFGPAAVAALGALIARHRRPPDLS